MTMREPKLPWAPLTALMLLTGCAALPPVTAPPAAPLNADMSSGNEAFSEYTANGGSLRVLVPEWMAVVMDPAVPTTLIPTPPSVSSAAAPATPGTSLEAIASGDSTPAPLLNRRGTRDDLRINVSASQLSADGRFLSFTLTRSGLTDETTRVNANTSGYVADQVPSVQAQVVFAPGVVTQELRIPLMRNLPQEEAATNPYDQALRQDVSLNLSLLSADATGPSVTSTLALNALNAFTPELESPTRPLPTTALEPAALFSRDTALQFASALWLTAQAINGKVYAIGGRNGITDLRANEEFDPATNSWRVRAGMPTARGGMGSGTLRNLIQVFGG